MEIKPVARFHCPVGGKFGLPRQSGIVDSLKGHIVFEPKYRNPDAIRGLEGFSHIWLIWGFSCNGASEALTVRPPRLGGNERVGVFASRSPFRPNPLGISSVRIESIDFGRCEISVSGADLADGTPIYDIKPYVRYCDSHPDAVSGFVDSNRWKELKVEFSSAEVKEKLTRTLGEDGLKALCGILSQDPRPQYADDPDKNYGLTFSGHNIRFHVADAAAYVDSLD